MLYISVGFREADQGKQRAFNLVNTWGGLLERRVM